MCPKWPTWSLRWPTWRTFGSTLATFFASWARSCPKWRKPKKRREYSTFEGFLGSRSSSWRLCRAILGHLGAILHHLGAILGHLGAILVHFAPILRQLGDKMRPKSAKTSETDRKLDFGRILRSRWPLNLILHGTGKHILHRTLPKHNSSKNLKTLHGNWNSNSQDAAGP